MKRGHLGFPLTDHGLNHIRVAAVFRQSDAASGIRDVHRKLLIEQKAIQSGKKAAPLQAHSDVGEGRIAGLRKGMHEIQTPVAASMVTADGGVPMGVASAALPGIIFPVIRMLPDIFQSRYHLKGGSGRIKPLRGPV